ncbi:MAG: ABC transporter permease subunit [Candidatus Bathyarchaeota archaeon]|nr:ABC transporter permease subunit [Candidatus Bathyarchaeota archaeon]
MRWRKVLLVFRKDWWEISRNWQVLMPILVVPLLFTVALPAAIIAMPEIVNIPMTSTGQIMDLIVKNLPVAIQARLSGLSETQVMIYVMVLYFFAPLFLIIPLMASSVISSDSFAGEKERRTIEALLATPITDGELFMGKILVSFVPSMMVTAISFVLYTATVDILAYEMFGRLLLPNLGWVMLIFCLAPTVALASIGLTVMVSSRVRGFREAQQISVVLIVPVLMLIFAQAFGALIFGPLVIGALTAAFAVADLLLFRLGVRLFRRDEILSQIS